MRACKSTCQPRNVGPKASQAARDAFGPAVQFRTQSIGGAKDTNTDAATLYENILTIQNAADPEWPATDPANAGVRGEFLLGIFLPDSLSRRSGPRRRSHTACPRIPPARLQNEISSPKVIAWN
jgi:hypothetical protein